MQALGRRALNPIPDAPGAYALILRLARETRLDIASLDRPALPIGLYLYAGSAWGPGGIRARVGRHLRRGKARVWHVDHLTEVAAIEDVVAFPGGRECAIVAAATGASVPIVRFGASDCRRCEAHLLAVEPEIVGVLTSIALDKDNILTKTRI